VGIRLESKPTRTLSTLRGRSEIASTDDVAGYVPAEPVRLSNAIIGEVLELIFVVTVMTDIRGYRDNSESDQNNTFFLYRILYDYLYVFVRSASQAATLTKEFYFPVAEVQIFIIETNITHDLYTVRCFLSHIF